MKKIFLVKLFLMIIISCNTSKGKIIIDDNENDWNRAKYLVILENASFHEQVTFTIKKEKARKFQIKSGDSIGKWSIDTGTYKLFPGERKDIGFIYTWNYTRNGNDSIVYVNKYSIVGEKVHND
jgi:hypothetical protein